MQRQAANYWKLLFDKQHGQWGEPAPDPSECFASVPLNVSTPGPPVEMVTITLHSGGSGQVDHGAITIQWGTLDANASFKVK